MIYQVGDEAAVNISGIRLPLYGKVVAVDHKAKKITCRVYSKYGERTMIVDQAIAAPWRKP